MDNKRIKMVTENLKERMKKKGISAYRLSRMIGIPESSLSLILNGKKNFTLETLFRITDALKIKRCI